jgi:hypothetical protein
MSLKTLIKAIPVLAILAASGSVALAQSVGDRRSGWWQQWGMGQMMGRGPMMGYGPDGMLDRIDGRLAFIKTELGIRDDQATQWSKFADTVRANAENQNGLMRSMMDEIADDDYLAKPLPERLAEHEDFMQARLEQIKEVRAAVDAMYGVLDDTQKKVANDIMMPAMGMSMGMGMGIMMR